VAHGRRDEGADVGQPPDAVLERDAQEAAVQVGVVVDREVTLAPDVEGLALLGRPKPFAGELDRKAVHPLTSLCPRSGLVPPGASLHTRPTGSRTRSRRATPCSTGPRDRKSVV